MSNFRSLARPFLSLVVGLSLIVTMVAWSAGDENAADATKKKETRPPLIADTAFSGHETCSMCHDAGGSSTVRRPGGLQEQRSSDGWLKFDEYSIWASYPEHQAGSASDKPHRIDKHGQAYQVLFTDRAKKMGALMKIPGQAVHLDQRCVACHSGYPIAALEPGKEKWMLAESVVGKADLKFGVTCEGCHGGAAGKQPLNAWLGPHMVSPPQDPAGKSDDAWRYLASADKRGKFGFTDVRSPVSKSRLCLSCHLGNAEAGRVVTHEMYAAGHPPLPGFELETFSRQMPAHWRTLAEKGKAKPAIRDDFLSRSRDEFCNAKSDPPGSMPGLRSLLVCGTVTLSEHFRLTAALAEDSTKADKQPWPELAQYDCFACHHDLQNMGWRSQRKPKGRVGRPMLREWPVVLARIAFKVTGRDEQQFDAMLTAAQVATTKTPFGTPSDVYTATRNAADILDAEAIQMQRQPLSEKDAADALKYVCEAAAEPAIDYDSARQLAWAAQAIVEELQSVKGRAADPELDKAFANLDRILHLSLRDGQALADFGQIPNFRGLLADLAVSLPPISKYGPDAVRAEFRKIAGWRAALEKK